MPCKVTFYFNQGKQGWSETYYNSASNPRDLLEGLGSVFLTALTTFRANLTGLYAARATQIDANPRNSYLKLYRGLYRGGVMGDDSEADVTSTDAVCLIYGSANRKRRVFFRGLPDVLVKRNSFGDDVLTPGLRDAIQQLVTQLNIKGFTIRSTALPPAESLVWHNVYKLTNTDDNAPGLCDVWFAGETTAGNFFKRPMTLRGVPGTQLPKFPKTPYGVRIFQIRPDDYSSIPIQYGLPSGATVFPTKMKATNVAYTYDPIVNWTFERFSEHKTGRPFGALRGALKVALRR